VDVEDFEFMQSRMHILEGGVRGETAILESRIFSEAAANKVMRK
jgi:hypothetical protein